MRARLGKTRRPNDSQRIQLLVRYPLTTFWKGEIHVDGGTLYERHFRGDEVADFNVYRNPARHDGRGQPDTILALQGLWPWRGTHGRTNRPAWSIARVVTPTRAVSIPVGEASVADSHAHAHMGRACCTAAVGQNEKNPHNEKKFGDVSRQSVHSASSSS